MMWNWLLSSLAIGATVVLYDGNPAYPDPCAMWRLIQDEKVTIFGTSASYINYIKSVGLTPGKDYDLSSLRQISQTGSALSAEGFEYVYNVIKEDVIPFFLDTININILSIEANFIPSSSDNPFDEVNTSVFGKWKDNDITLLHVRTENFRIRKGNNIAISMLIYE